MGHATMAAFPAAIFFLGICGPWGWDYAVIAVICYFYISAVLFAAIYLLWRTIVGRSRFAAIGATVAFGYLFLMYQGIVGL